MWAGASIHVDVELLHTVLVTHARHLCALVVGDDLGVGDAAVNVVAALEKGAVEGINRAPGLLRHKERGAAGGKHACACTGACVLLCGLIS